MDKGFEQTVLPRRHTNDQYVHGIMLNIISHYREANPKQDEIPHCTHSYG